MSKTHDQLIELKGKIDEIERLSNNYLTHNPDVVYIIDRIETIERENVEGTLMDTVHRSKDIKKILLIC